MMERIACAFAVSLLAAVAIAAPRSHALAPLPIAGEWLWGTGAPPPRGPVHALMTCGSYPAVVTLVEHDGVVDSEWHDARPMVGGAARAIPPWGESISEKLRGAFDGTRLVLDGTHDVVYARSVGAPAGARVPPDEHHPIHVDLRFNAHDGHFVGTRNGTAIWLARGTITPSGARACPP